MERETLAQRVLALDLTEAVEICREAGIKPILRYTKPPQSKMENSGRYMVVRFVWVSPDEGELTLASETMDKEIATQ